MLTPGSLSLMKGGLPLATSPSRVSSTFLAETLPWVIFLSSWEGEKDQDRQHSPGPWGSPTCGAEPMPARVNQQGCVGAMGMRPCGSHGAQLRGGRGTWMHRC